MGERGVSGGFFAVGVCVLFVLFALPQVAAHKNPVVEYAYVGHIWEESYTTNPRQPVVNEEIVFLLSVVHPGETIEGNVSGMIAIYRDETTYRWFGGKSYARPDIITMKDEGLTPTGGNRFTQRVTIGTPGSYHVVIDWYENGLFIGQSIHVLDIEQRTIGPMYLAFTSLVIVAVLLGVWAGVL